MSLRTSILIPFVYLLLNVRCASSQTNLIFIPLTSLGYSDTLLDRGKLSATNFQSYLIKNFVDDTRSQDSIDLFVKNAITKSNFEAETVIVFYKESSVTNLENIRKDRKIIDRYSQDKDWVYQYRIFNHKIKSVMKVRNGKVVDTYGSIEVRNKH